ncbi:hypothetical protein SDRG_05386 [Saprolegnia diclina VS20]|uniref:Exportin-1/Importin-beta-like domain-containing protein n=1 Tax=Saprolegnia diclina (strain VS20) TaxID=1156394 RepID=T0QT27_SAPDV|nr:hypothetical protein SDRG_05386 [Saprolegnia diclina VS20]EQC37160.1 hypothetical protein SDRG_05386 [Saprolegnia diclina VS20]|eukprot:XP_008609322.1 hypothetical protein SDRG_05386 [Saprolegnia diclina VS20]
MATLVITVDALEAAIAALYGQRGPDEQRNANEYLLAVADSSSAWPVGLTLLAQPPSNPSMDPTPIQYFAANMIYSKLRKEYVTLAVADQQQIQAQLEAILHQVRAGQLRFAPLVSQRVCMAIAFIYLCMDGGCARCVQDCVASSSTASPLVVVLALELLTSLCDENTDAYLPMARKDSVVLEITEISPTVFEFLSHVFRQASGAADIRYAALLCLKAWIKGAGLSIAKLYTTMRHVFDSLLGALCVVSADAVVTREVVVCASILGNALQVEEYPPAAAKEDAMLALTQGLLASEAGIQHYLRADENVALALTTLVASFGESELEWLIAGSPEALALAELMLAMTAQPNRQIASLMLDVWLMIQDEPVADRHEVFRDAFFRRLLHVLLLQCAPTPEDEDDDDAFHDFRATVVDVVLSVYALLKDEFLKYIAHVVQTQTANIGHLDAALFLLSTITVDLKPRLPTPDAILTSLCSDYIFGHASFSIAPSVIQASSVLLGQLNGWLALPHNTTLLATSVRYLASAVGPSPKQACKSLLQLSCAATDTLSTMADLISLVIRAMHEQPLELSERLLLIEAIVRVATAAPWCMDALTFLAGPILSRLQEATQHEVSPALVATELACLTTLLRFADAPTAAAGGADVTNALLRLLWPVLTPVAARYGSSETAMDALLELVAAILKAKRDDIEAFGASSEVAAVLEMVVALFAQFGYASSFGPITVAIEVFGPRGVPPALRLAFHGLSQRTFEVVQATAPSEVPDTIRGFFDLAQRCIMFCPGLLFEREFGATLQLAQVALARLGSHREGLRSVIFYVNYVVTKRESTLMEHKDAIDGVLGSLKDALCLAIVDLLAAGSPTTLYAPLSSLWFHFLTAYGPLVYPAVEQALLQSEATTVLSLEDKNRVFTAWTSLSDNYQERRFNAVCLDVAKVCRREMTADVLAEYDV